MRHLTLSLPPLSPDSELVDRLHENLMLKLRLESVPLRGTFIGITTSWEVRAQQLLTHQQISRLIEIAFWASLRFNEGRSPRISLVAATSDYSFNWVKFANEVAYSEAEIVKLAVAISRQGCLLVRPAEEGGLSIWGIGHTPHFAPDQSASVMGVRIVGPAVIRVDIGEPFAVIDHSSVTILQQAGHSLAAYLSHLFKRTFAKGKERKSSDSRDMAASEWWAHLSLVRMVLALGHGGLILIVPDGTGEWTKSLDPFAFRYDRPDKTIYEAIRESKETGAPIPAGVRSTAALTGVDGAIVITQDLLVLGFGATIAIQGEHSTPVCRFNTEDDRAGAVRVPLEQIGGTKHQSAARFVAAHRDAIAIAISQDRQVSVMHWDDSFQSVGVVKNSEWWA